MIPKNLLNKTALKKMAFRKRCESGQIKMTRLSFWASCGKLYARFLEKVCEWEDISEKLRVFRNQLFLGKQFLIREKFFFLSFFELNDNVSCIREVDGKQYLTFGEISLILQKTIVFLKLWHWKMITFAVFRTHTQVLWWIEEQFDNRLEFTLILNKKLKNWIIRFFRLL